ncbi:MAG: zinc ribbon domain-containing protein, partial [Ktedonobacterales bacterium]
MRQRGDQQTLNYDVRLPDAAQADALRLLEASRGVVNTLLTHLWPRLDEFGGEHRGPAWKQVVGMTASPDPHGDRQFRCEAETAGRILRAQAQRKHIFLLIQPILSDGFIRPKTEKRPAGKNRKTIKEALEALSTTLRDDEASFVTMQNVVEQACNFFLAHGAFPARYE